MNISEGVLKMFRNLLKYDLRYIYKVLVFLYLLILVSAILTRILFMIENSAFASFMSLILQGTTITLILSILINNLMRCWARLVKNFYGDESYLTHTLPIRISELFTAKFVAALITFLSSAAIIIVTLLVMYYSHDNLLLVQDMFQQTFNGDTSFGFWEAIIGVLILVFLEVFCILSVGYTGIVLGHRMNSRKMFWSIIFGLFCYGLTQAIVFLLVFALGMFDGNVMSLFTSSSLPSGATIRFLAYSAVAIYLLWNVIYYVLDIRLLRRGINID